MSFPSPNYADIHTALRSDDDARLKSFLDQGLSPDAWDADRNPLLSIAVANNAHRCFGLLMDSNANVNASGPEGYSVLHTAALNGNTEACRALLDRGATTEAFNTLAESPLHVAAEAGHAEVCRVLIEHGMSVDATDIDGETPLYKAARDGHTEVAEVLIGAGATVSRDWDSSLIDTVRPAIVNQQRKELTASLESTFNLPPQQRSQSAGRRL